MGQNATSAQCVVCHVWYLKPGMRMANPAFPRLNADRVCPECVADSPASKKARAMEYPWDPSGEPETSTPAADAPHSQESP